MVRSQQDLLPILPVHRPRCNRSLTYTPHSTCIHEHATNTTPARGQSPGELCAPTSISEQQHYEPERRPEHVLLFVSCCRPRSAPTTATTSAAGRHLLKRRFHTLTYRESKESYVTLQSAVPT